MYHVNKRAKSQRRRLFIWSGVGLIVVSLVCGAGVWARHALRPQVSIKQAATVTTKVSYTSPTKQYHEPDFTVALPTTWQSIPRTPGPYQSYTWQSSDRVTDGQVIEIFEDTIPANFAVNRVLVVTGEVDHLQLDGPASDSCSNFTKDVAPVAYQVGVPAKWQGVSFLCDQKNQERDVIGTSSTDGVNMVILKDQGTGVSHKFLFTYTDYSTNPDYTVFYNVLQSLHMD